MSKPFFTISDNPGYVGLNTTVYSDHNDFCNEISKLLKHENNHCVNYYSIKNEDNIELICIIADDTERPSGFTFLMFFKGINHSVL